MIRVNVDDDTPHDLILIEDDHGQNIWLTRSEALQLMEELPEVLNSIPLNTEPNDKHDGRL